MLRVKSSHWTADFTIARALAESFRLSGKKNVAYICVGDPSHVLDRLGPTVGEELSQYYAHIVGTVERPVGTEHLCEVWDDVQKRWPDAFIIGIEAAGGDAEVEGTIEVSDRGLQRAKNDLHNNAFLCDAGITAYLWSGTMPERITPEELNRLQRVIDVIVDAQIRFLQRVKVYEPEL